MNLQNFMDKSMYYSYDTNREELVTLYTCRAADQVSSSVHAISNVQNVISCHIFIHDTPSAITYTNVNENIRYIYI